MASKITKLQQIGRGLRLAVNQQLERVTVQYLIGLTEFAHLTLQLLDPSFLGRRLAWPFAAITLDLTHPNAKAVRRTTQFTRDRRQRRSFALILIAVFHRQPHRTLAELR